MRIILRVLFLSSLAWADTPPPNYQFQSPLLKSGAIVSIQLADATHSGYLSSSDWNHFNSGSGGAVWGSITGLLSNQTDLVTALGLKQNLLPSQTGNAGKYLTTNGSVLSWGSIVTTGPANTFAGYDIDGNLSNIPNWLFTSDGNTMSSYSAFDASTNNQHNNMEVAAELSDDIATDVIGFNNYFHYDRNNTGHNNNGNIFGMQFVPTMEGSGHVGQFRGVGIFQNMGGNSATADDIEGLGVFQDVGDGNVVTNARVLNLDLDSSAGGITGNATIVNINSRNQIDNDLTIIGSNHSNAGYIGHDFRFLQMGQDAEVKNNYAAGLFFSNGVVRENYTGFANFINNDVGTAGHNNYTTGYDFNIQNGHVLESAGNGFNFTNNSSFTGNSGGYRWNGLNINQQGNGGSFGGVSIFDSGNMADEKRGIQYNAQGSARTLTALDLQTQTTITDDVQAIRINMNGTTSANQGVTGIQIQMGNATAPNGVRSINAEGGTVNINSEMSNIQPGFNIGNYESMQTDINSPTTGAELVQQIVQSNLFFHQPMSGFPFALGVTGFGVVNQIAVDPGVTQPYYRAMIFGASNPASSLRHSGLRWWMQFLRAPSLQ